MTGIPSGAPDPGAHVEPPPAPDEAAEDAQHASLLVRMRRALLVPVLALITALAAGAVLIVFTDPDTLAYWNAFGSRPLKAFSESWDTVSAAYSALFRGAFGSRKALSETMLAATPLMLAGLSVGFAFRAGLFNIGAAGQFLIGATCSTYVGFAYDLPKFVHLPLAVLAGFVGGALWGGIVGLLKARSGAHEVITTIMLNYIALRLVDYLLTTQAFLPGDRKDPISQTIKASAELPGFSGYRVHAGLIIGLAAAGVVWWLLFRSTWGFQARAVGANPNAATYAGMSVATTWVVAMLVAGGLSGLAGATQILGVENRLTGGLTSIGFDAIALALLGRSHPGGIVAASVLFGALESGALQMRTATDTPVDIVVVIQALIIVFIAAPELIRAIYRVKADKGTSTTTVSTSWG